jgi:hypothetical protein
MWLSDAARRALEEFMSLHGHERLKAIYEALLSSKQWPAD